MWSFAAYAGEYCTNANFHHSIMLQMYGIIWMVYVKRHLYYSIHTHMQSVSHLVCIWYFFLLSLSLSLPSNGIILSPALASKLLKAILSSRLLLSHTSTILSCFHLVWIRTLHYVCACIDCNHKRRRLLFSSIIKLMTLCGAQRKDIPCRNWKFEGKWWIIKPSAHFSKKGK